MEKVRWLDDDEMRVWRSFLDASVLVLARINDALKRHGSLTLDDYEVLVALSSEPDRRLRMSDLSRRLRHSQSRATQRVDRLMQRGLVSREKSDLDARVTFACLTDLGRETMDEIAPKHLVDVRDWLIDLVAADERLGLAEILERLALNARGDD